MQRRLVSVPVDHVKMNICHRGRNHEKCCRSQQRTAVVYVGIEPCHSTQAFSLVVWALEDNRKRCPKDQNAPVLPQMQPLTELLLVVQAGPFSLLFALFFHHLLSHLQQQTTRRYQQLLLKPFPFSTLLQCPTLLLSHLREC